MENLCYKLLWQKKLLLLLLGNSDCGYRGWDELGITLGFPLTGSQPFSKPFLCFRALYPLTRAEIPLFKLFVTMNFIMICY